MSSHPVVGMSAEAIAQTDRLRARLTEATAKDDVKQATAVIGAAETWRDVCRRTKASEADQRAYAALSLDAQAAAGRMLEDAPKSVGGRGKTADSLSEVYGITHKESERWQRVGKIPDQTRATYIADCDGELTRSGLLAYYQTGLMTQSGSAEWYTPALYIEAARTAMGGIDLDPASSQAANQTVRAAEWFGPQDGSLDREWWGRVWLNPPYGRTGTASIRDFVDKAVSEYEAGRIEAAILLVPSHSTASSWFQQLWDHTLCFTDHRIGFTEAGGAVGSPTFGSAFAYFGKEPQLFAASFGVFGAIMVRLP